MAENSGATRKEIHFIIKSWVMGSIGGSIFFLTVFILETINFFQSIFLGISTFVVSLVIARLFQDRINIIVNWINRKIRKHPKISGVIDKYF